MGLSASQARLLNLTARLSDLELHAQQISNSKIRLAMNGAEASEEYERALDKEELFIRTGVNSDGTAAEQDLSYFNLTGVNSPLLTQYGLCDTNGRILVTQQEAGAFKQANGSVEDFCDLMGAPTTITYSNSSGVTLTQTQYDAAGQAYQDAEKALNDYGQNNGNPHVQGYTSDGNWAYSTQTSGSTPVTYSDPEVFASLVSSGNSFNNAATYSTGSRQATYSPDGSSSESTALCFYQGGGDPASAASSLTSVISQITSNASDAIKGVLQGKLGGSYNNISGQIDSAASTASTNTQSYYNNQLMNKQNYDGDDLDNVETIKDVQGTNQVWDDTHGNHEYYIDLSQVVKTFLANFDAAYASSSGAPDPSSYSNEITNGATNRPATSGLEFIGVTAQNETYNSTDNPDNIEYLTPAAGETTDSVKAIYDPLLATYKETKAYYESFNIKNVTKSEHTDYYTNLYNKMVDGYFTESDEADTLNNPAWTQAQILNNNLVLYKCTKDQDSGKDDMTWKSTEWNNCNDIEEQSDSSYTARAEAKYEAEMADINSKDKRFDLELKNIDTEHEAIQTEVDSVKKVIDKNIEHNFKMFQA